MAQQKTFVLVHGAWGASYNYFPIVPLLEAAGHRVFYPSLTGHGERKHLSSPTVSLETHILDIANLIVMLDLQDVFLVGHSYGGMVITGVWDRVRERIRHVVYVDAFVPTDGQALWDVVAPERIAEQTRLIEKNGGMIPFLGDKEAEPWVMPQSAETFRQPLSFTRGSLPTSAPKTYILATANVPSPFHQIGARIENDPSWHYHGVSTGHNVMGEATEWFVSLLCSLE